MKITIDSTVKAIDAVAIVHHSLHQSKKDVMHDGKEYSVSKVKQIFTVKRKK